jgi:hypothetical protein
VRIELDVEGVGAATGAGGAKEALRHGEEGVAPDSR